MLGIKLNNAVLFDFLTKTARTKRVLTIGARLVNPQYWIHEKRTLLIFEGKNSKDEALKAAEAFNQMSRTPKEARLALAASRKPKPC